MKTESGLLKTCHDTESAAISAGSPSGCRKSSLPRPPGQSSRTRPDSRRRWSGPGKVIAVGMLSRRFLPGD
jgi:hypothetical protein